MRKVEFAEFLQDEIREEIPELENAQMWLRYIEKDNDRSYYGLTIKISKSYRVWTGWE